MRENLYMSSNLFNKDKYLAPIKYINNTSIIEYDIESAGLNILTTMGWFSMEDRERLLKMNKNDRVVVIGKLLRSRDGMNNDLMKGFVEARRIFFEKNSIEDRDVLSIKRDAIFLINKPMGIDNEINELIHTRKKSSFTEFMLIGSREHYYNINTDKLVLKGYEKGIFTKHENYLFKFLKDVFKLASTNQKDELFLYLATFKDNFLSYNLDIGYYRDIITGKYLYELNLGKGSRGLLGIDEVDDPKYVMINNNLAFITEVISTVM